LIFLPKNEKVLSNAFDVFDIHERKILYRDKDNGLSVYNYDDDSNIIISFNRYYGEMYGDFVVYTEDYSIRVFKLSSKTSFIIREQFYGFTSNPSIYGNNIVWIDNRNWYADQTAEYSKDIYLFDLHNNMESQISKSLSNRFSIDNYEDVIVWHVQEFDSEGEKDFDIFMMRISDDDEIQITTEPGKQWTPKIYGDNIIWIGVKDNSDYIYHYNIKTKKTARIEESKNAYHIDIDRNIITWDTSSASYEKSDLFIYHLKEGKIIGIDRANEGNNPKIYLNRIVWSDNHGNIRLYTFPTRETIIVTISVIALTIIEIYLIILLGYRYLKKRKKRKDGNIIEK